jgi:ketosteroid isomerase-like protein
MIDIISGIDTDTGATASTKKGSKAGVWVALFCLVALAAGGAYWIKSHRQQAVVASPEQQPMAAVKKADAAVLKAVSAHDLTTLLTFYAGDAVSLPANEELLTSHPEIQKSWATRLIPGVDISWTPMYVEVAKSGDLAYILGSYNMTTKVAKGKPVTDHGKYLAIWKKQADGSWKVEADTWNSDLPVKAK